VNAPKLAMQANQVARFRQNGCLVAQTRTYPIVGVELAPEWSRLHTLADNFRHGSTARGSRDGFHGRAKESLSRTPYRTRRFLLKTIPLLLSPIAAQDNWNRRGDHGLKLLRLAPNHPQEC